MNVLIKDVAIATGSVKVSNHDLSKNLDTTNEWIKTRTGIENRYYCSADESNLTLAIDAIKKLEINILDVDAIVFCSMSSTNTTPSRASLLQSEFGLSNELYAVDINAACSGFIYGFIHGSSLIQSNLFKKVLVVCSEQMSKIIDHTDRSTAILFGDSAGVIVLENSKCQTIFDTVFKTRSNISDLYMNDHKLAMNGQNVFKFAVKEVSNLMKQMKIDNSFKHLILHQANVRIIKSISKRLNLEEEKFIVNIDKYANTSAASIILALDEVFKELKNGDKIFFAGFGAGLSWGGLVYIHQEEK